MSGKELEAIKAAWVDSQPENFKTHSDDCVLWHHSCCIARLLQEIDRLSDELKREQRYRKGYAVK